MSPVGVVFVTPTAVLLLPRFQSVQIVLDIAGVFLRGNFAEKNDREAVAVVVERVVVEVGPLDLGAFFDGLANSWVVELAGLEKRQGNQAFAAQMLVGVPFEEPERGVDDFFDVRALGRFAGTDRGRPVRGQQCRICKAAAASAVPASRSVIGPVNRKSLPLLCHLQSRGFLYHGHYRTGSSVGRAQD